jgi:peptidyl-tRNA hydrolase, PTH1 family
LHVIVGLGNPGSEYARTRHNAGFMLVERLAERWSAGWRDEKKFSARIAWTEWQGRRVLLAQPQTYMNSSGEAVGPLARYYQAPMERVLVTVDDADLPLGHLRLRPGGGTGGHHGLESIERCVGTADFPRLRIGIGRRNGAREITSYVLSRFDSTELALVDRVLDTACGQAECWLAAGIQMAMTQFNGAVPDPADERKEQ